MSKSSIKKSEFPRKNFEQIPLLDFERASFLFDDCSGWEIQELRLEHCALDGVVFNQAKIEEGKIIETVFTHCSFVGTELHKPFFDHVEMISCRLQGTQTNAPMISETHIRSCKAVSAGFRFGTFKKVLFEDCDLSDADFAGATLDKVIFRNCDLTNAQFSQAKLKQVSLKGSRIENIHIDKGSFGEVVVDTAQALYLASIFGLRIED